MVMKRQAPTIEGVIDDEFLARRAIIDPLDDDLVIPFNCNPFPKPRAKSSPPMTARAEPSADILPRQRRARKFRDMVALGLGAWCLLVLIGLIVFGGMAL